MNQNQPTDKELGKRRDNLDEAIKTSLLRQSNSKIRQGRIILVVIAIINLLTGVFDAVSYKEVANAFTIVSILLAFIFLVLVLTSLKHPYQSILIGLSIFVGLHLLAAFFEPSTLLRGVLIKIIIIVGLVKGLYSAKDARELNEQLAKLEAKRATN